MLVASHDMLKTKSGCHFRVGVSSEIGPLFWVEADPKTTSENGGLKDHQLRVCKVDKTGFATRKRSFSDPGTVC